MQRLTTLPEILRDGIGQAVEFTENLRILFEMPPVRADVVGG